MTGGTYLVPRESTLYQEFVRLYRAAQRVRPTGIDRWNGDLYATPEDTLGGFDPASGAISLSTERVLRHLTGAVSLTERRGQAQALATVLHEATHGGMPTDAPNEPNAVRSPHSLGLMEGVAEVRTFADFDVFTEGAGYPGLVLTEPQYPGAFTATDDLLDQVSGPRKTSKALLAEAVRGPGAMHFDQFADAVVKNRLHDIVPARPEDQQAVRAALISTMTHAYWPTIHHRPADAGHSLAGEVRQHLDAKVDQIRHHYSPGQTQPFPAESPNQFAVQAAQPPAQNEAPKAIPEAAANAGTSTAPEMRFLTGLSPAAGATRKAPSLGQGQKGAGSNHRGPTTERERD
ncbi:hypothetical protein FB561_7440 [Kribbella amoyensis]|uniref:Uncharacterized protein n=1 Tax=Kribbella amoyensis TaxID=996641 RepID=A0A561B0R3_9ACTN|nr:hypothetical protein [Kribbella amoyensis]TWD72448.1 hypothetical protein FB561_7440 [Kribbella amoyensis]